MFFDQNWLICIWHNDIDNNKDYIINLESKTIQSKNINTIVLKKNNIEEIDLKNIWDWFECFLGQKRNSISEYDISKNNIILAFSLFDWFDENSGQIYFFCPKVKKSKIDEIIKYYLLDIKILENRLFLDKNKIWQNLDLDFFGCLDLIFWLSILYGKINIKNNWILSIQIQIPIFGKFLYYEDFFDNITKKLSDNFIFLKSSKENNKDWFIYQITIKDWEFLSIFIKNYHTKILKNTQKELFDIKIEKLYEYMKKKQIDKNITNWFIMKILTK